MPGDDTVLGQLHERILSGTIEHKDDEPLTIDQTPRILGRNSQCDMSFPKDKLMSKVHIALTATGKGILIEDLGSTNGTLVDGDLLSPKSSLYVRTAKTIQIGGTILDLRVGEERERPLLNRFGPMTTRATSMQRVFPSLEQVAKIRAPVLLMGETGTGKTSIARMIHEASDRRGRPFVSINLGQTPDNLIESALFGHERGSFTSAIERKESPFDQARGGTVLIDEIGAVPLHLQSRLLGVLSERKFMPVGGSKEREVDVRIITATLDPLLHRVNEKTFRHDLYCRIAGATIVLPPLRDRLEDIEVLARDILAQHRIPVGLTPKQIASLKKRNWPGNIRQLRHVLENALDLWPGSGPLDLEAAFSLDLEENTASLKSTNDDVVFQRLGKFGTTEDDFKREMRVILYSKLWPRANGVLTKLAEAAGVSEMHARRMLSELGLREVPPQVGGRSKRDTRTRE